MGILLGVAVIVVLVNFLDYLAEERSIRKANMRDWEELELQKDKYRQQEQEIFQRYGWPTNVINISEYDDTNPKNKVYVFAKKSVIMINKIPYNFSNILSFKIERYYIDENGMPIENGHLPNVSPSQNSISTTTTSTGNMIGRAAVGGLLFGGVGAAIGAATAKKKTITTEIKNEIDLTPRYIVIINTNKNLGEEIHIPLLTNHLLINRIKSILTPICNQNTHQ